MQSATTALNRARIMVVDDNPMNLEVLSEALSETYELALAEDGSIALQLAPSFQPDVLLLDVMMPGRDGFDVCRTFKRTHSLRNTRVIMVSARAELASRLTGYESGADDYVTKPFDEEELLTKIRFALKTKRLLGMCGAMGEVIALVSETRDIVDPLMDEVREFSLQLGNALRNSPYSDLIDQQFIEDLYQASALRDVGLLAVPEAVLDKDGRWSIEELEQVKQHTLVGGSLLDRLSGEHPTISLFRTAAEVARSHHERFDGSGYPHRVAGTEIPLAARIVSVAETLATLQSTGQLSASAFNQQSERGGKLLFDPVIGQAASELLKNLPERQHKDVSILACLPWAVEQPVQS